MSVLAKHIGHRCVLLDAYRLRCVDCSHIVLLPKPAGSTSTSQPLAVTDPARCPRHIGERDGVCGQCRAEGLEWRGKTDSVTPTADHAAGAALVREALANRRPRDRTDADGQPG